MNPISDLPGRAGNTLPAEAGPAPGSGRMLSSPRPEFSELVAARAYHLWIEAGQPEGRDQEHWFTAEHEMRVLQPESDRPGSVAG